MRLFVIFVIFATLCELCYSKKIINKCCQDNEFVYGKKMCRRTNGSEPAVLNYVDVYTSGLTKIGYLGNMFDLKPGYFAMGKNRENSWIYSRYGRKIYLIEDGSALLDRNVSNLILITTDEFCIDNFKSRGGNQAYIYIRQEAPEIGNNPLFYKCGFLISSIFLLLVLLVYSLLPELRNLGGLILMGYVGSLMVAYLLLFILQATFSRPSFLTCITLTFLIYFFLMSSFCWMNVMSFDIWWTFRGYAKARSVHRRGISWKFRMYCLYAFGLPLAMTVAMIVVNETDMPVDVIKPRIPQRGCFFEAIVSQLYMYLPMLVIILLNWVFFGMTVFNIWRLSRGNHILISGNPADAGTSSAHQTQKKRFFVYLKLSVVMGLSWLLEIVSSVNPKFAGWYISDTYNVLIGLIIFILFICKKKILRSLKKRFARNEVSRDLSSVSSKSRSRSSKSTTTDSQTTKIPLTTTTSLSVD